MPIMVFHGGPDETQSLANQWMQGLVGVEIKQISTAACMVETTGPVGRTAPHLILTIWYEATGDLGPEMAGRSTEGSDALGG
jgi:hypothetical protein